MMHNVEIKVAPIITLLCPDCGSLDLDTLEVVTCVAECERITTIGPEYSGYTDYERGYQETVGVLCNDCNWEYEGEDWMMKLVPHNAEISEPAMTESESKECDVIPDP